MRQGFALRGTVCQSRDLKNIQTVERGFVVCVDGVSRGLFAELPAAYAGLPVRDFGDALILPGLVDLHVHAPQFSYRTLGMDLELLDWLKTYTFPEEARYADIAFAKEQYRAFVDDVLRGPNTRLCVFATVHGPATLALMDLLEASGLVALVGKVNMDRDSDPALEEANAAASLAATEEWLSACAGRYARTAPILTPRFIPSCSDALLSGLGALARRRGLPVQSHLSENIQECALVQTLHPGVPTYGCAYARFGLFGDTRTVMAHGVQSGAEEIALMRERGVFLAHCPQSNTNIASGIAPVRKFLEASVPVGLGSDVAGGCHTSIFRAMADAIQVSKLRWRLSDAADAPLTLAEAFFLATRGGGAFFGKVGSFDEGYAFDAVIVDDAGHEATRPMTAENRLARAVYLSDDRNIRAKIVEGRDVGKGR